MHELADPAFWSDLGAFLVATSLLTVAVGYRRAAAAWLENRRTNRWLAGLDNEGSRSIHSSATTDIEAALDEVSTELQAKAAARGVTLELTWKDVSWLEDTGGSTFWRPDFSVSVRAQAPGVPPWLDLRFDDADSWKWGLFGGREAVFGPQRRSGWGDGLFVRRGAVMAAFEVDSVATAQALARDRCDAAVDAARVIAPLGGRMPWLLARAVREAETPADQLQRLWLGLGRCAKHDAIRELVRTLRDTPSGDIDGLAADARAVRVLVTAAEPDPDWDAAARLVAEGPLDDNFTSPMWADLLERCPPGALDQGAILWAPIEPLRRTLMSRERRNAPSPWQALDRRLLGDPPDDIEMLLLTAIGKSGDPRHEPALIDHLHAKPIEVEEGEPPRRVHAHLGDVLWAMSKVGGPASVAAIHACGLHDDEGAAAAIAAIKAGLDADAVGGLSLATDGAGGDLSLADDKGDLAVVDPEG